MIDGTAECMHTYNQQLNHMTNLTPFFFLLSCKIVPPHTIQKDKST